MRSLPGALRQAAPGRSEWQVAAGAGALIALGPVLTIAGADLLAGSARGEARKLEARAAPRAARDAQAAQDRDALATLLRRPTLGATLDALARALPADTNLIRAERTPQGLLEADVSTTDPDALREAIRREPMLAGLRDTGQRQGDAAMIVSLREIAE
jgi:hypothetical protein